jgi:cytochrome c oxidase subunit 3
MSPATATESEQAITNRLGLWVFLATEVLFFGGMFLAYALYRHTYPAAFQAGARLMEFGLGTANTAVLLTSSFFMALGARAGDRRRLRQCLAAAAGLGIVFLVIKAIEYGSKFAAHLVPGPGFAGPHGPLELFFTLYFAMTGLHAIHMLFGLAAVGWLGWRCRGDRPLPVEPVAMVGLYWHFVDCIWVFLYPLFYLAGR